MKIIISILSLLISLNLCGCSSTPTYGKKYKYKLNEPIKYPDVTITCIEMGTYKPEPPEYPGTDPYRIFNIISGEESYELFFTTLFPVAIDGKIYQLDPMPEGKNLTDNYIHLTYPDNGRGGTAFFDINYNMLKEIQQNQRVDPIVKTPGDEVEAQGTQGHP